MKAEIKPPSAASKRSVQLPSLAPHVALWTYGTAGSQIVGTMCGFKDYGRFGEGRKVLITTSLDRSQAEPVKVVRHESGSGGPGDAIQSALAILSKASARPGVRSQQRVPQSSSAPTAYLSHVYLVMNNPMATAESFVAAMRNIQTWWPTGVVAEDLLRGISDLGDAGRTATHKIARILWDDITKRDPRAPIRIILCLPSAVYEAAMKEALATVGAVAMT